MSQSIISRTISSVVDQRLSLTNGQCGRLTSIGTNWNSAMIGVRWSINQQSTIVGGPVFAIGLCNGTTNMFGSATTTHWVGIKNGNNNASIAYANWPPEVFVLNDTADLVVAKKVGTTVTTGSYFSTQMTIGPNTSPHYRAGIFVLITKGSPNFTIQVCAANGGVDITYANFNAAMESTLSNIPSILTGYVVGTARTLAVNEATDGYLNAVNIYWNKTTPPLEISDVAIKLES